MYINLFNSLPTHYLIRLSINWTTSKLVDTALNYVHVQLDSRLPILLHMEGKHKMLFHMTFQCT